jgi:phage-related minor tail protein
MDIKEASAMTEASGLTTDQQQPSITRQLPEARANSGPTAMFVAEQMRQLTLRAPLRSLSLAFLLGVLLARRR